METVSSVGGGGVPFDFDMRGDVRGGGDGRRGCRGSGEGDKEMEGVKQ